MTATNPSNNTTGRAEVLPGLVLVLSGGAPEQLRSEAGQLREQARGEVFTERGGLTWVYGEEQALSVLEGAVKMLRAAAQDGWPCTAAMATGRIGRLQSPGQPPRFVGAALDRAALLQGLLQDRPGTLLCDEEAARLSGVQASAAPIMGARLPFGPPGDETQICYEVLWDRLRPGDLCAPRAQVTRVPATRPRARPTRAETAMSATPVPADAVRADTPLSRWVRGTILRTGRTFGFIEDPAGLVYYFQPRNVAIDASLRRGARVVFRILPAMRGASELRAEDVFVLDAVTSGVLERVNPKGWGLVRLDCQNGLEHRLFVQNAAGPGWRVGRTVSCRIGANRQGPVGLPVTDVASARPGIVEE